MTTVLNYPHIGIFVFAWFAADLLIPILIRISHRMNVLDRPGGHKGQSTPVPFLGGIGIFLAFTISVCSTLRFESFESFSPLLGVLVGGVVVVVLGFIDDLRPINALVKLSVLFLTTLVLASFGICLQLFPNVFYNLPNIVLTLLWIVGVTSATNSLDNTDGVVGGVCAIASFFMFAIAWGTSATDAQPWLSYLAVALGGSCLGFLRYNFAPARIYLGDNGAFLLGFLLATMLVFAHYSADPLKTILIPGLVLSVPVFDIVLATVLRVRDGDVRNVASAVLYCGRDHLAHLLMGIHLTKRQTALAMYFLALLGGFTALLVMAASNTLTVLTISGMYGVFLIAVGTVLGGVRPQLQRARVFSAEDLIRAPIEAVLAASLAPRFGMQPRISQPGAPPGTTWTPRSQQRPPDPRIN